MGLEEPETSGTVQRETTPTKLGGVDVVNVDYGEIIVTLDEDGRLKSFGDFAAFSGRPESDDEEKYKTDEEAWEAFEEIISRFDTPTDVERTKLTRANEVGLPYWITFLMDREEAYGYPVNGGNRVFATMDRMSGKIISFSAVSGWSYEGPNIRTEEADAVAVAIEKYGGVSSDWNAVLRYSYPTGLAAGPKMAALMALKKMRLMYVLSSDHGSVIVDSVTGKLVDYGQFGLQAAAQTSAAGTNGGTTEQTASEHGPSSEDATGGSKSDEPITLLLILGGIGVFLIVDIFMKLFVRR